MAGSHPNGVRPIRSLGHFGDAGLTVLRSAPEDGPEIWCRCDGGPHGFLSIAAHAHADALAIELRYGGTDVLADPGTYCYSSEPRWRSYFRSTLGHNTVEIGCRDQSVSGGPTLWTRHAQSQVVGLQLAEDGRVTSWSAEHDGYTALDPPAWHRRTVRLLSQERRVEIIDEIRTTGRHPIRLAFHLGPAVSAELGESAVELSWEDEDGAGETATLHLPRHLEASLVRASGEPPIGWYSSGFGTKEPATTVLACGLGRGHEVFKSVLKVAPHFPP
jgi:hypothetical protein